MSKASLVAAIMAAVEKVLQDFEQTPTDTWSTDSLAFDGAWAPDWLVNINANVDANYPTGWKVPGSPMHGPASTIDGIYWDKMLSREDLSSEQRDGIHSATQSAFPFQIVGGKFFPIHVSDDESGVRRRVVCAVVPNAFGSEEALQAAVRADYFQRGVNIEPA